MTTTYKLTKSDALEYFHDGIMHKRILEIEDPIFSMNVHVNEDETKIFATLLGLGMVGIKQNRVQAEAFLMNKTKED